MLNFSVGHSSWTRLTSAIKNSSEDESLGSHAMFFKVCWPIVGPEVFDAISNFFTKGKLLKQVKNNFITLIPKYNSPTEGTDYRSISLANELYKIIARVLAGRLKPLMDKIISPYRSAFMSGRSISYNILLSHDLIRSFQLAKGKAKMCLKLALSK